MTGAEMIGKMTGGTAVEMATPPSPQAKGISRERMTRPDAPDIRPPTAIRRSGAGQDAGAMPDRLRELAVRERLFRRRVAEAFQVPSHIKQRRDRRLAAYDQEFPAGLRYGRQAGFADPDWLSVAEQGLDDCANFVTMQAQFASADRRLEAEIIRKTTELAQLLDRLRSNALALQPR